jgi:hypothetical protein
MAQTYGTRPSRLLGLLGDGLALDFDLALFGWGRRVNHVLDAAQSPAERQARFGALMRGGGAITRLSDLTALFGDRIGVAPPTPQHPPA